jgi:hypothetical protein
MNKIEIEIEKILENNQENKLTNSFDLLMKHCVDFKNWCLKERWFGVDMHDGSVFYRKNGMGSEISFNSTEELFQEYLKQLEINEARRL